MKLKIYNKFNKIKAEYNNLYNSMLEKSIYQSPEFINGRLKYMKFQHIIYNSKYKFYKVVDENDEIVLILPIQLIKSEIKALSTLDSLDLVYNSKFSDYNLSKALKLVINDLKNNLIFENVCDGSILHRIVNKYFKFNYLKQTKCGKINFDNGYDNYLSSLSKSSRQNLRTSYNRLNTDNCTYRLEISFGQISYKKFVILKKNYAKRFREKNINCSMLKKLFVGIYEPISKLCSKLKCSFNSVLYINDKIAAFMSGFTDGKIVTIPRLAFNSKYNRYSPGNILINETIKYLISKSEIKILDLGIGGENYKFAMGAEEYLSYNIEIVKEND